MAWSARRKEQHRIFFAHGIGLFDLTEKLRGICELRLELGANFFAYLITAAVNAWADRGLQIARPTAEAAVHLAHTFLHNAFHRASPSGMKHTHSVLPGVDENNGQAVGGLNAEQQTRSCGDQAIAGEWRFGGRVDEADDVGMNLAQRNQRPRFGFVIRFALGAELTQERGAVSLDGGFGVVFGESKVERVLAIYTRESARPRGKAMDKPRDSAQMLSRNNIKLSLLGVPLRHSTMLPEAFAAWRATAIHSLTAKLNAALMCSAVVLM